MFKGELSRFVQKIRDARGVVLIGLDGIPIEKISVDEHLNLEALAAEHVALMKKSMIAGEELGTGQIYEFSIFTNKIIMIIRSVTPEYFVVVALSPNGNYGRVRFELRKLIPRLAEEIS